MAGNEQGLVGDAGDQHLGLIAACWERQMRSLSVYRPVFEQAYEQLLRIIVADEDLGRRHSRTADRVQIQHRPEFSLLQGDRGANLTDLFMRGGDTPALGRCWINVLIQE